MEETESDLRNKGEDSHILKTIPRWHCTLLAYTQRSLCSLLADAFN